ncbi:hypothetical protein HN51_062262 [Arachis hypogaea]|uniref:uncharacterized protein LOC110270827 n=1 Tax=Arachis ipaensis TaxID=130454 RepID=UPI000A2B2E49|nr:uncharacterized protein LOC110270827 [Arachis ipaensis]XP_025627583.1 uncharacterized protein LOC112720744 [Arachis hypogaea]QHO19710.1 uncharacterized protein DS421_11g331380 [Arachis hypogaea]
MPTKMVSCSRGKAVLVRVYAEKHGKRRSSIQQHRHHHHVHQTFRQEAHSSASKGYDRRAGLLNYSHQLRASAKGTSASSTPLLSMSTNIHVHTAPTKMTSPKKKPNYTGTPTCFGNWKLLIPSFLRSWCNAPKKKKKVHSRFLENRMKIFQKRRGRNFFSNVYSVRRTRACV